MSSDDFVGKEKKDYMTSFTNEDGSGKIFIFHDEQTGKYYASKFGDVAIKEDNGGDGAVHFMNGVNTEISIDGNVELFGKISANIKASGNIHKNDDCTLDDDVTLLQNTYLDSYDIVVKNGILEFTGKLCEDNENKNCLYTDRCVVIKKYADVTLNRDLSIIVNEDDYSLHHKGNRFTISNNVKLMVQNTKDSTFSGYAVVCECSGSNKTFNIGNGSKVELYGKKHGIRNYEHCTINVGGSFNVRGGEAFVNYGKLCIYGSGDVNVFGFEIGYMGFGSGSKAEIQCGGKMVSYGEEAGVTKDISYSSFIINEGASLSAYSLAYEVSTNYHVNISGVHEYVTKIAPKAKFDVAGNLYVYSVEDENERSIPIKVRDTGKVFFNGKLKKI